MYNLFTILVIYIDCSGQSCELCRYLRSCAQMQPALNEFYVLLQAKCSKKGVVRHKI